MDYRWIVVVDKAGAKIFRTLAFSRGLTLIKEFQHPRGRKKSGELASDRGGRTFHSVDNRRSVYDPPSSAPEKELKRFMKHVVDYLRVGRANGSFKSLMLVASPKVLGDLRKALPEVLRRIVVKDLAKEFPSWLPRETAVRHLQEDLDLLWT